METNNILNEAFFKKSKNSLEKRADRINKINKALPGYNPMSNKVGPNKEGLTSVMDGYAVTDMNAAKQRLTKTFGNVIGSNNVRSLASKSIKSFPIIVSDTIQPETVVMIKKVLEEQYAEYINLLISNEVVDLSSFRAEDPNGNNIAIQAVNKITGSSPSLSSRASSGRMGVDDLFNTNGLFKLFRTNESVKSGNEFIDNLLENALIVESKYADQVANNLLENFDYYSDLNTAKNIYLETINEEFRNGLRVVGKNQRNIDDVNRELNLLNKEQELMDKRDAYNDRNMGMSVDDQGNILINKLSTADVIVDADRFANVMNRSVGEMLNDPENAFIKDRFQKATFLLHSRMITGLEYKEYLVVRLGIPVSDEATKQLIIRDNIQPEDKKYHYEELPKNLPTKFYNYDDKTLNRLDSKIIEEITNIKMEEIKNDKKFLKRLSISIGAGGAGAVGGGVLATLLAIPWIGWAIAGAGVLAGGVGAAISANLKKKRAKELEIQRKEAENKGLYNSSKAYSGWRKVEKLINEIEFNKNSVIEVYDRNQMEIEKRKNLANNEYEYTPENMKLNDYYNSYVKNIVYESVEVKHEKTPSFDNCNSTISESSLKNLNEAINEAISDDEFNKTVFKNSLSEAPTTVPFQVTPKIQYQYDPDKAPEVQYVPAYSSRSQHGYGQVEYDKRDNQNRKYNSPLILKVSFKERLSSGDFTDNELTAIIGILGVVTRVPSSEMTYILKANTEGVKTNLPGLDAVVNDIASLFTNKLKKDIENLPQSADVWENLEKVSRTAIINNMAGKNNDTPPNAHLIFTENEVSDCKNATNVDYLKNIKEVKNLMKKYGALSIMIANDDSQKLFIYDSPENISWDVVPYTALRNKDTGDSLQALASVLRR